MHDIYTYMHTLHTYIHICFYRYNLYSRVVTVKKNLQKVSSHHKVFVPCRKRQGPNVTPPPTCYKRKSRGNPTTSATKSTHSDVGSDGAPRQCRGRRELEYVKALHKSIVRSRVSERVETIDRMPEGPDDRSLLYIPAHRRYSQAVPPDVPADKPNPYDEVYDTIPDSALAGLPDMPHPLEDTDMPQSWSPSVPRHPTTPSPEPPVPSPEPEPRHSLTQPTQPMSPTPTFPDSPAPTLHQVHSSMTHYSHPPSTTPQTRDFKLDYEGVMSAIGDLHSVTRFITGKGASVPRQPDPRGVETTREEVVELLAMLKTALDRLFRRIERV